MPADLPLFTLITAVLQRTPVWAWALLVGITLLGVRQARAHVTSTTRLVIAPLSFGVFSLVSAVMAFGGRPTVCVAWALGVALPIAAARWLAPPHPARYEGAGRYAVPGSLVPLGAMWGVFLVRYVTTVAVALNPTLAQGGLFSQAMPFVYGALSGLFMARALRIVRTSRQTSLASRASGALQSA